MARTGRGNNNSPETGPETPDDTSWFGNWLALTNPVEMTFQVRFEQMGSNEHADSAIESAVFQWLFLGRFGNFNFTLVRGKRTGSLKWR